MRFPRPRPIRSRAVQAAAGNAYYTRIERIVKPALPPDAQDSACLAPALIPAFRIGG
jgi:hypothetical protein